MLNGIFCWDDNVAYSQVDYKWMEEVHVSLDLTKQSIRSKIRPRNN